MLQTASTVHTGPGAPTCHVAPCAFDTERHPVSLSDHARAISGLPRPYVNVYAVYTALPTSRGFSGTLSTLPSLVRIGLCAFSIYGHAPPDRDLHVMRRSIARTVHIPLIQDRFSPFPTYFPIDCPCEIHVLPVRDQGLAPERLHRPDPGEHHGAHQAGLPVRSAAARVVSRPT